MARMIHLMEGGPHRYESEKVKAKLRQMVRALEGVDFCEPTTDLIRRQTFGRNDADYRLMLNICSLLLQQFMPTEAKGSKSLPGLKRDELVLYQIYETFVANFYRFHLKGWGVTRQAKLSWFAEVASPLLPGMAADLVLRCNQTGRKFVLDTKFTAASLVSNQWGSDKFNSGHIYQIYAYLRSQEAVSENDRTASGVLLYPTVSGELNECVKIQGHEIHFKTVDLSKPWEDVEARLLSIVS